MSGKEIFYTVLVLAGMSGALFAIVSVVIRVIRKSIHDEIRKLENGLFAKLKPHGKSR